MWFPLKCFCNGCMPGSQHVSEKRICNISNKNFYLGALAEGSQVWVCYSLSSVKEKERFRQVTKSESMPKMEGKISHFMSGQRTLLAVHIYLILDATERKCPKWMNPKLHIPHNVLPLNLPCWTVKLLLSKMQQLRRIILFISVLLHSQIHNSLFKYSLLKMRYNWEERNAD